MMTSLLKTLRLSLLMLGAASAISLAPAHAGDRAFTFGIGGGLHGGSMNHFKTTLNGTTDPIKEGMVGINYGYQVGVDLQVSILWVKAMYLASNYWITDWAADPTGATDRRYTNTTLFTPILFKVKESPTLSAALGVFNALPLSTSDVRDWGLAIGLKGQPGSPKLFWDLLITGGFINQGFGAQAINMQLGLGVKL